MKLTAQEKFNSAIGQNKHITVGLDSDIKKIPAHLLKKNDPILEFNKIVIDSTAEYAGAYKINFAFYENHPQGFEILKKTIEYIPSDILVIGDAKRGDIGNTSRMYAEAVFEHFKCDAVTLHPYMGSDSLSPFLDFKDKLNFILALTSNPGSSDFEKIKLADGSFLFQNVIRKVSQWNTNGNCGIVFGATHKSDLIENIDLFSSLPVLLPGVGAQGGSLEDVKKIFENKNNIKYLVNISRALIYCDSSENFAAHIKKESESLNNILNNKDK
jgi:orotidine-5'-phosphate decarboxylase